MDSVGAEVGLKMRSAIKAKLMELGCYVDDELPDYIMVMVANKRSKSQMEEDLQLFLRNDTSIFVEWLHQVLKKLKEVTITNPELCNTLKELKRKAAMDVMESVIKKEKKEKKQKKNAKSLTDEIPVKAIKLVERRNQNNTITENDGGESSTTNNVVNEDNFDIPSLAEVNSLEDSELDLMENKIKEARSRIVMMHTDSEDEDFINIRADAEELLTNELDIRSNQTNDDQNSVSHQKGVKLNRDANKRIVTAITTTKVPIAERLGAKVTASEAQLSSENSSAKRSKISLTESLREEKEISGKIKSNIKKPFENRILKREAVHKRLGVLSSVVSLQKPSEPNLEELKPKSVLSVVKVKPRRLTSGPCQANKNLLLKAVAEAQKSVTQIPARTPQAAPQTSQEPPQNIKSSQPALFTKKYREKYNLPLENHSSIVSSKNDKKIKGKTDKKVQNIIIEVKGDDELEVNSNSTSRDNSLYEPVSVAKDDDNDSKDDGDNDDDSECIPSAIELTLDEDLDKYIEDFDVNDTSDDDQKESEPKTNHQFIVTLDGLKDKRILKSNDVDDINEDTQQKLVKKVPSPIIFDKKDKPDTKKPTPPVPDKLPKVQVPLSLKAKERCKFWPNCRLKDSCEFVHPNTLCKMFPLCKFGDKCLYLHPKCKFDASCTRKDCPYSHATAKVSLKMVSQDVCKYFPKCANLRCPYYHPKPCRFGKFCLNKSECNFSHGNLPNKEQLTWHSSVR